jgi:hypothetical protein
MIGNRAIAGGFPRRSASDIFKDWTMLLVTGDNRSAMAAPPCDSSHGRGLFLCPLPTYPVATTRPIIG